MPLSPSPLLPEILRLQYQLDEEEQERGAVYEKYGSAGERLIPVIGEVAELCKEYYPHAVLALLEEFLDGA